MLLTKREEQLLKAFLNVGKLSMQDMIEILQVSSRTIYRTLAELTETLDQRGIQIIKKGKQYFLRGNLDDLLTDLKVVVEYSQQERLTLITYRLLTEEDFITNESLQESMKVSNVTIIQDIADIFANYDLKTEIICASVRNPIHITDCALAGADIATVPYKVIEQMVHHPLTDAGIEKFKKDYIAVFGE